MGLAETAELAIKISLTGNAQAGIKNLKSNLGGLGKAAGSVARGVAIGAGAAVGLASAIVVKSVRSGLDSLAELESAVSSVDGAIKQVGLSGSGLTGAGIADWANQIEASIGAAFDDKAITQATSTLLRFGKVTPTNLRPAMVVMTDLATKTGDVDSAASLLAKALAAPEKAAGKLARVGIILTKEQQKQITAMVAAGDAAGAQKVLLDALAETTKGAALASQGPYQRSLSTLKDVTEDAQKALAEGFLPVIERVRDILNRELAKPSTLKNIREFGQSLADGLSKAVDFAQGVDWGAIAGAAKSVASFGKGIADGFLSLPPEAKGLILSLAALNKLSGGAVIKVGVDIVQGTLGTLFNQFLGKGSPANPMFVVPVDGGLGGGLPGGLPGAGVLGTGLSIGSLGAVLGVAMVPVFVAGLALAIRAPDADKVQTDARIDTADKRGIVGTPTDIHRSGMQGTASADGPTPVKIVNQNLFPDVRDATLAAARVNQAKLDYLRDKIEGSRIATVTALGSTTNQVRTSGAGMIGAIRGIDVKPSVHVTVRTNVSVTANSIRRSVGVTSTYSAGHVGANLGA